FLLHTTHPFNLRGQFLRGVLVGSPPLNFYYLGLKNLYCTCLRVHVFLTCSPIFTLLSSSVCFRSLVTISYARVALFFYISVYFLGACFFFFALMSLSPALLL